MRLTYIISKSDIIKINGIIIADENSARKVLSAKRYLQGEQHLSSAAPFRCRFKI